MRKNCKAANQRAETNRPPGIGLCGHLGFLYVVTRVSPGCWCYVGCIFSLLLLASGIPQHLSILSVVLVCFLFLLPVLALQKVYHRLPQEAKANFAQPIKEPPPPQLQNLEIFVQLRRFLRYVMHECEARDMGEYNRTVLWVRGPEYVGCEAGGWWQGHFSAFHACMLWGSTCIVKGAAAWKCALLLWYYPGRPGMFSAPTRFVGQEILQRRPTR